MAISITPTFENEALGEWLMLTRRGSAVGFGPARLEALRARARQLYSSVAKQAELLVVDGPKLQRVPIHMPATILAALPILAGQATRATLMEYESSTKSFANLDRTLLAAVHLHHATRLQGRCTEERLDMDFALDQEAKATRLLRAGDGSIASAAKQYSLATGFDLQQVTRQQAPKLPHPLISTTRSAQLRHVTDLNSANDNGSFRSFQIFLDMRKLHEATNVFSEDKPGLANPVITKSTVGADGKVGIKLAVMAGDREMASSSTEETDAQTHEEEWTNRDGNEAVEFRTNGVWVLWPACGRTVEEEGFAALCDVLDEGTDSRDRSYTDSEVNPSEVLAGGKL